MGYLSFVLVVCSLMLSLRAETAQAEKRFYNCYRSFNPEPETTTVFAQMGIPTRCFFAANTINSVGGPYCQYPQIWLAPKRYDFGAFDRQVEDLIAAGGPDARFLCMIDLNTPYWLTRKFGLDSFAAISHASAIPEWRRLTTEWMLALIAHAEAKWGGRIQSYILSGGGTSEWYEYDKGFTSRAKNSAWHRWCVEKGFAFGEVPPSETELRRAVHENVIYDPATEGAKIEYWRFHNQMVSDALLHFASAARVAVPKSKEIGAFFGYYLVSDNKLDSFGHLDYERVFASPDIDYFIAPGTYHDRVLGGGSGSQLVPGTLLLNGKRFLHEIDHATHCVRSNYWKTTADDIAGNTREFAFALINHASLWWFDMWGGYYREKPLRDRIESLGKIGERFAGDRSKSLAEVLFICDPQSAYYVNERSAQSPAMAHRFRNKLNRIGAPFDVYSFNDLSVMDLSQYKVIFLPATVLITPQRAEMLKTRVLRDGRFIVWTYAPGISDGSTLDVARIRTWAGVDYKTPGPTFTAMGGWTAVYSFEYNKITPVVIKDVCRRAGVHLYSEEEIPVYANERLLCVHVKNGGKKTIHLPKSCPRVVDLLTGNTVAENTEGFEVDFASPDTRLFELIWK